MIRFACPNCHSNLQIDDAHAGVKVRCQKCGQKLLVPVATTPAPQPKTLLAVTEDAPVRAIPLGPQPMGAATSGGDAVFATPPLPGQGDWYYRRRGESGGPVRFEDLEALAASDRLRPRDEVWRAGMAGWAPAHTIGELRAIFRSHVSDGVSHGSSHGSVLFMVLSILLLAGGLLLVLGGGLFLLAFSQMDTTVPVYGHNIYFQ